MASPAAGSEASAPWSGGLFVMDADRVEPLDLKMAAVVRNIRAVGHGSRELLSLGKS